MYPVQVRDHILKMLLEEKLKRVKGNEDKHRHSDGDEVDTLGSE